jgi:cystathionine gamma-synthase
MDFETLCVHGCKKRFDNTGAISVPIFQSATFVHPGVGSSTGYDYTRLQNPTREALEKTVTALEGGVDALAFSSGMAAISALMELFSPGDQVVASADLYGGTHRLFSHISRKNGVEVTLLDTTDLEETERHITGRTKALFVETPTNPMMQVTDIRAAAALCRKHGLLFIVDNTFLTPYFQRPLSLGADVAVHSGTKFLGGHNDTMAGFLVTGREETAEKLRFIFKTTGAGLSPFDSWLLLRGIKTLAVRMQRQQQSAMALSVFLQKQEKVRAVHYAGLPSHPGYAVSQRQSSGYGAMISFEVDSEETARAVLERVKVVQYAESLGGTETLITYPVLQTHADVPEAERERRGISRLLLRLSVGLENQEDLIEDLRQALEG